MKLKDLPDSREHHHSRREEAYRMGKTFANLMAVGGLIIAQPLLEG